MVEFSDILEGRESRPSFFVNMHVCVRKLRGCLFECYCYSRVRIYEDIAMVILFKDLED